MKRSNPHVVAQPKTLRVGILGAGQMARQHARAIGRLGDATVSAVVDPDPSALEEIRQIQPGAIGFASLEDLLRSQPVDVVHICTPPQTHELLTEQALNAGCHVYVEKPFVETYAAATRLAKASRFALDTNYCTNHRRSGLSSCFRPWETSRMSRAISHSGP
jgi:predicted dehydrogenase